MLVSERWKGLVRIAMSKGDAFLRKWMMRCVRNGAKVRHRVNERHG